MTERDYKAIALVLNKQFVEASNQRGVNFNELLLDLGGYFKSENPNYDHEKFIREVLK